MTTAVPAIPDNKPNWPRIRTGMELCQRHYPGVVGAVLSAELDSWSNFGYRLGGKPQIDRLLEHLEMREATAAIVHRMEVEG